MRTLLIILGMIILMVACFPRMAQAQIPDSYTVRYYNVGAAAPVQTLTFLSSAVSCTQPVPPPTASTTNPGRLFWAEINVANSDCMYVPPATDPLFSLPVGNYEGTLTANNAVGPSPESARSPFSRSAMLAAPTGFRVIR